MKNILKIIIIITMFLTFNVKAFDITSKNAILYNLDNNEVLYEKASDERVQIASLTKIMTALITLENVDNLDEKVTVINDDLSGLAEKNLVTAGFRVGQELTYRDLLYALLLPSAADSACILSRSVSIDFIKLMNDKAQKLKMNNTHFSNVIGLDNEDNYSTASDLAILFKEALNNKTFKEIISSKEYMSSDGKMIFKSSINKNASKYGIDVHYLLGGKTGTTDGAGLCLASIAFENDVNYMLITLGAPYDKIRPHNIDDAKIVYDYFIQNYANHKIVDKKVSYKTLKTEYLKQDEIKLYPKDDIVKYLPNDYNVKDVRYEYKGVKKVSFYTNKKLGTLEIYYKDKLIDKQSVYLKVKTEFSFVKFIKGNILIIGIIILLVIVKIRFKR